jgi:hypothetical protein
MDRRKFLIGMGSLAAGSAAAVGTGAFSQASLNDRPVNVSVVNDAEGFLALSAEEVQNGEYAEVNENGKLEIHLNSEVSLDQELGFGKSGTGLNTDSVYYIDSIFAVYNASQNEGLDYGIDWSGLDHPDNFEFYWMGRVDGPEDRPDIDRNGDDGNYVRDAGIGGTPSGSYESFGLGIKTPAKLDDEWETGTVRIFGDFDGYYSTQE